MNDETLLLRQIHPSFIRNGAVTSQAFRPTPKDEGRLSCDDGDRVTAEHAYVRYTTQQGLASAGVQAVAVSECKHLSLSVEADGVPYPEHASIVFSHLSSKGREKASKKLRQWAGDRGWKYVPGAEV